MALVLAGCTSPPPADSDAAAGRTLASLRKVDDLPLYEMRYIGDYDATRRRRGAGSGDPVRVLAVRGRRAQGPLFGRNFDWDPNPAMVLHTDPPDGYASVSIVDISYLGVLVATRDRRPPAAGRAAAAVRRHERARAVRRPGGGRVGAARGLIRRSRRWAACASCGSSWTGPPPWTRRSPSRPLQPRLRRRPAAALPDRRPLRCRGGGRVRRRADERRARHPGAHEHPAERRLGGAAPHRPPLRDGGGHTLDRAGADGLGGRDGSAARRRTGHTRWSAVYDPATGKVRVVAGQRWNTVHTFELAGF